MYYPIQFFESNTLPLPHPQIKWKKVGVPALPQQK